MQSLGNDDITADFTLLPCETSETSEQQKQQQHWRFLSVQLSLLALITSLQLSLASLHIRLISESQCSSLVFHGMSMSPSSPPTGPACLFEYFVFAFQWTETFPKDMGTSSVKKRCPQWCRQSRDCKSRVAFLVSSPGTDRETQWALWKVRAGAWTGTREASGASWDPPVAPALTPARYKQEPVTLLWYKFRK